MWTGWSFRSHDWQIGGEFVDWSVLINHPVFRSLDGVDISVLVCTTTTISPNESTILRLDCILGIQASEVRDVVRIGIAVWMGNSTHSNKARRAVWFVQCNIIFSTGAIVAPSSCKGSWLGKNFFDVLCISAISRDFLWRAMVGSGIVSKIEAVVSVTFSLPNREIRIRSRSSVIINPFGCVVACIIVHLLDLWLLSIWIQSVDRQITVVDCTYLCKVSTIFVSVKVGVKGLQLIVVWIIGQTSNLEWGLQHCCNWLKLHLTHGNWRRCNLIFCLDPAVQLFLNIITCWKHCALGVTFNACFWLRFLCVFNLVRGMRRTATGWVSKVTRLCFELEVIASLLHVCHVLLVVGRWCNEASSHRELFDSMRTKLIIEFVHLINSWWIIHQVLQGEHELLTRTWWNRTCVGFVHLALSSGSAFAFLATLEFTGSRFESCTALETCGKACIRAWSAKWDFGLRFFLDLSLIFHSRRGSFRGADRCVGDVDLGWVRHFGILVVYLGYFIPVQSKSLTGKSAILLGHWISLVDVVASCKRLQVLEVSWTAWHWIMSGRAIHVDKIDIISWLSDVFLNLHVQQRLNWLFLNRLRLTLLELSLVN